MGRKNGERDMPGTVLVLVMVFRCLFCLFVFGFLNQELFMDKFEWRESKNTWKLGLIHYTEKLGNLLLVDTMPGDGYQKMKQGLLEK